MHFDIYTLLPQFFYSLELSILGKALEKKLWSFNTIQLTRRDDDTPYGGGHGMIVRPDTFDRYNMKGTIFYMSPRGKKIDHKLIDSLKNEAYFSIICCRYGGLDQRVIDKYNIIELSIGDIILSGGEIPALALIDGLVRKINGVVGNCNSIQNESFENFLLEHDQYTKPAIWNGLHVPEILRSGHDKKILQWKLYNKLRNTYKKRKDLWKKYQEYARISKITRIKK